MPRALLCGAGYVVRGAGAPGGLGPRRGEPIYNRDTMRCPTYDHILLGWKAGGGNKRSQHILGAEFFLGDGALPPTPSAARA